MVVTEKDSAAAAGSTGLNHDGNGKPGKGGEGGRGGRKK